LWRSNKRHELIAHLLNTTALTAHPQPAHTPVQASKLLAVHLQQLAQVVQLLLHTRHSGCLQMLTLLALTHTQLPLLLSLERPVAASRRGLGVCCCQAAVDSGGTAAVPPVRNMG
jgi:hypothetical protein